jgi:hypothetical protein
MLDDTNVADDLSAAEASVDSAYCALRAASVAMAGSPSDELQRLRSNAAELLAHLEHVKFALRSYAAHAAVAEQTARSLPDRPHSRSW